MDAYNQQLANYNAQRQSVGEGATGGKNYQAPAAPVAPKREDFLTGDAPPSFSATTKLSPEQQALYDLQTGQDKQLLELGGKQISRIQDSVNTPFSYAGIGNEITAEGTAEAQRRAEEALMSRLSPQFGRDEEALRTRLINQGIVQGSDAYNNEFNSFAQKQNDARMQAILSAGQYAGDLQNQTLQRRNQGIQEYTTQRNAPLNEYTAFTSGTQIQNPQFQNINYQGTQPVDYTALVNQKYQADQAGLNAKTAARNQGISSLFGLGGSVLGAAGGAGGFGKLFS